MSPQMVIIGAGLAGLSAAYTAARQGWQVWLCSSLPSERAQSVMAEGGINAALDTQGQEDSPAGHGADTLRAACGLADPNAVLAMTAAAPALVTELADLGVPFNRMADGQIDLRYFGGQKKKRTAFSQSDTGKQLMTALIDAVRRYEVEGAVHRLDHHDFLTLFHDGPVCTGASLRDTWSGETCDLPAQAVLIASGGLHGLFGCTTGSLADTGAVTAELFRLGLPVANGEFIQYHPTTIASNGKRMLVSEAARGEGGRLWVMKQGQPWYFMEEKYPELGNLMPRDVTAREIWYHCQAGETVWLDLTGLDEDVFSRKLSGLVADCQLYGGVDIRRQPIAVAPGIHYFMGGLAVDEWHRTPWKQLYAAGECACQYHGANRLGGNSLLGAIYGGRKAAGTAMEEGRDRPLPRTGRPDMPPAALSPAGLACLRQHLDQALGVVRSGEVLARALDGIADLPGTLPLLGRALLQSALGRQESRGAHWRSDFPHRDDDRFLRTTLAVYDGRRITLSYRPVPEKRG